MSPELGCLKIIILLACRDTPDYRATVELEIIKLVHGGSGLGELGGKKIFVPYASPGDVIDACLTADHGDWAEGKIVSMIKSSPKRVKPKCPVFGICGGCQWQHIDYGEQLKWKKNIVAEALCRIGKMADPPVGDTLPSPKEWNYRNRIQLHVDSKGRIGFYEASSKKVVEFEECLIADERLNKELNSRRSELSRRNRGIALRIEGSDESFAQVNTLQNKNLISIIAGWTREIPHETALELHCGSGNFSFAIAEIAKKVVSSDIDGRAIRTAKERLYKTGAKNIEFICVPEAMAAKRFSNGCDIAIVDPPRKGCLKEIETVIRLNPKSIIYVSCNPATLARDGIFLTGNGFRLQKALPVDMFPQTFHTEVVALFRATSIP